MLFHGRCEFQNGKKNWPSIEKFGITHMEENYSSNRKSQIIGSAHPSILQGIKLCRRLFLIIKERFEASSWIESMKAMEQATPGSGVQVLVLGVQCTDVLPGVPGTVPSRYGS